MKATDRIASEEINPGPGFGVMMSVAPITSDIGRPSVLKSYPVITTITMTARKSRYEKIFISAISFLKRAGPSRQAAKTTKAPR